MLHYRMESCVISPVSNRDCLHFNHVWIFHLFHFVEYFVEIGMDTVVVKLKKKKCFTFSGVSKNVKFSNVKMLYTIQMKKTIQS